VEKVVVGVVVVVSGKTKKGVSGENKKNQSNQRAFGKSALYVNKRLSF